MSDSWFTSQSQQPDMTLGIIAHKWQKSAGDNESIQASKSMGRVIPSRKQGTSGTTKWTLVQQKLDIAVNELLNRNACDS